MCTQRVYNIRVGIIGPTVEILRHVIRSEFGSRHGLKVCRLQ